MEKTAVIVPGEKQEPPGPYSIGFENILVAKARVGWWKFRHFQHASRRLLALPVGAVNGTYNICHREYPWMFQVAIKSLDQGGIRIGTEKKILGLKLHLHKMTKTQNNEQNRARDQKGARLPDKRRDSLNLLIELKRSSVELTLNTLQSSKKRLEDFPQTI